MSPPFPYSFHRRCLVPMRVFYRRTWFCAVENEPWKVSAKGGWLVGTAVECRTAVFHSGYGDYDIILTLFGAVTDTYVPSGWAAGGRDCHTYIPKLNKTTTSAFRTSIPALLPHAGFRCPNPCTHTHPAALFGRGNRYIHALL